MSSIRNTKQIILCDLKTLVEYKNRYSGYLNYQQDIYFILFINKIFMFILKNFPWLPMNSSCSTSQSVYLKEASGAGLRRPPDSHTQRSLNTPRLQCTLQVDPCVLDLLHSCCFPLVHDQELSKLKHSNEPLQFSSTGLTSESTE